MKVLFLVCLISQIFTLHASTELCPDNNWCTKKQAKTYQDFKKVLKSRKSSKISRFIGEYGLPIRFLALKGSKNSEKPISWDSRCEHHKKKGKAQIIKGEAFLRKISKNESMIFPKANIGKHSYLIPYQLLPYYIENKKMIFLYNIDHFYFEVSISKAGKVAYHQSKSTKTIPAHKNITCDKDLEKGSRPEFNYSICQEIWNKSSGHFDKIRYDWSCP